MHLKISFAKWWPFLSRGRRVKSTCTILNYMVLFHTMLDAVFPHHLLGFHNTDKPDSDLSKVQTSVMRSLAWLCVVPCHRIQRCILLQRMYFLAVLMIGAQPLPEPMLIQCLSPPPPPPPPQKKKNQRSFNHYARISYEEMHLKMSET